MAGILRGAAARVKSMGGTVGLSLTGNRGVCVRRRRRPKSWRHMGKRGAGVMKKLDRSKAEWIIGEKRKGTHNRTMAEVRHPGPLDPEAVEEVQGRDRVSGAHGQAQGMRPGTPGALCDSPGRLG